MSSSTYRLVALCGIGLWLAGCGFLKPSGVTPRSFVLTPLSARPASAPLAAKAPAVGIGQVKIPGYLFRRSMAVRYAQNEIVYLENAVWAERMDVGLQRVLAANLSALLPTDQVRFSAWRSEDISAEVYVSIEQLDVDAQGEAVLIAWWRVLSPGTGKTNTSGRFSANRSGPPPEKDPQGAVASLSALVADLAQQLAPAIK